MDQFAIQQFAKLPDLMKQILVKDVSTDLNMRIGEHHGITSDRVKKYIALIRGIIYKDFTPELLPKKIEKELGFDQSDARSLALDLLGYRVLPMQWYIGDVEKLIVELGGDLEYYKAEAEKNYPEVYHPELAEKAEVSAEQSQPEKVADATEPTILRNIEDRLASSKGRAEVLLRLTALSQQIEDAAKANKLSEKEGQDLMHSLDALSYAVNTQDLNPLETAAIKRRLKSIIAKLDAASA